MRMLLLDGMNNFDVLAMLEMIVILEIMKGLLFLVKIRMLMLIVIMLLVVIQVVQMIVLLLISFVVISVI